MKRDLQARGAGATGRERGAVLFGGVFDPVHNAHLQIAREALAHLPVDRVVFLPAGRPPHKQDATSATPAQRLEMLWRATRGFPHFEIDPREIHRVGPSYTVLSLRELRREHPRRPLFFLIGGDNVPLIAKWYEAKEILELCTPVVVPRPSAPARFEPQDLPFVSAERLAEINSHALGVVPLDLSSSDIRARLARDEDVNGLLPAPVLAYIEEQGLYRA